MIFATLWLSPQRRLAVIKPRWARHPLALAVALSVAGAMPASAAVVIAGTGFTQPGTVPGNDLLWVGSGLGTTGSIDVNAGSIATFGALNLGWERANGSGLIDGAGTTLTLNTAGGRLTVGVWGTADLYVLDGAKILGDGNDPACNGACGGSIASFAGTTGTLLVGDPGSEVRLRDTLNLATASRDAANGFGTAGGTATANLTIDQGGRLVSGGGWSGSFTAGVPERSVANIRITDANSAWVLAAGSQSTVANRGPNLTLATNGGTSFLDIVAGGRLRLETVATSNSSAVFGNNGGSSQVRVDGVGSVIEFTGAGPGVINLGRSGSSTVSTMSIVNGGVVRGAYYTGVGRDGATSTLTVQGAESRLIVDGNSTLASNGNPFSSFLDVARGASASGTLNVRDGAQVQVLGTTSRSTGPQLRVGQDAGSNGLVTVTGTGSTIQLRAASVVPGGGSTEAINPAVSIGRLGNGTLEVSAGGRMIIQGNAVSTVAASRSTVLHVGGFADTASGGTGLLRINGAGSEVSVLGSDAFVGVGRGAGATGTLILEDQGRLVSTVVNVGRSAGNGTLTMSNGRMDLAGQQTGSTLNGPTLSLGIGAGTGTATLSNGAVVTLSNPAGTASTVVVIGGSNSFPGGNGTMTLTGGSRIEMNGPAAAPGGVLVGRDGTGQLSLVGSSLNAGAGVVSVAALPSGIGSLLMSQNSTLQAAWVGVGRNRDAAGVVSEGGSASLVVSSGSVLTAPTVEIGANGVLGGNGTIIGNVINGGTINPGNSPGTLTVQGNYSNSPGARLVLEVGSDGGGGFVTDQLIFGLGSSFSLASLAVEFRFLGNADPIAFQATGAFSVDSFLRQQTAGGGSAALGNSAFADVAFTASAAAYVINNFSYTPGSNPTFTATPVPEPGTWLLLGMGVLALAAMSRRRQVHTAAAVRG